MTTPNNLTEIVAGLDADDIELIAGAVLADSHEYWLTERLSGFGMEMGLAGSDLVLTPLGLAVRTYLQEHSQ